MADVFEARADLNPWRERLWKLIEETPNLDWLLLTKRPEQVVGKVPWEAKWPRNVWLGTTAENQLWASKRIPILLSFPAAVRFVSCEPLLGPVDLTQWLSGARRQRGIDWVIAGGESGPRARPMNPDWARSLRNQCKASTASFHFKQWGQWSADEKHVRTSHQHATVGSGDAAVTFAKVGKHIAGRLLDGRTWDELPIARGAAR